MKNGHNKHKIIVSTWNRQRAELARTTASRLFENLEGEPSAIVASSSDEYTFVIPLENGDGGYAAQDAFIRWLEEQQDGDGSRSYSWAAIQSNDPGDTADWNLGRRRPVRG
jgi:hypothetical protein